MRALLTPIVAIFIAGCATAPATAPTGGKIAVYDHKYGVTRYATRSVKSDSVGTSGKTQTTKKKQPSWYGGFGHP